MLTATEVARALEPTRPNVLVTGGSSGIGFAAARALARVGARVVLTGTSADRAAAAAGRIGHGAQGVALRLEDDASVAAAAGDTLQRLPQLDAVLLNAGVMAIPTLSRCGGVEKHFKANHLGHFALTGMLFNALSPGASVTVLTSSAASWAPPEGIRLDQLQGWEPYQWKQAYGQSKLANLLFARELARRTAERGLRVNALNPGVVKTGLFRHLGLVEKARLLAANWRRLRSPELAAGALLWLALHPDARSVSGALYREFKPLDWPPADSGLAQRLWEVSETLAGPFPQCE